MDYIDQVYTKVKSLPKGKYSMVNLQYPEKFIEAVEHLIDGEWLNDVDFTDDQQELVKHDFSGFKTESNERISK